MNYIKYIVIGIISIFILFGLFFLLMFLMFNVSIVWNWAEYPEYPETMPLYISTNKTYISLDGEMIRDVQITEENVEGIVRNYLTKNYFFPDDAVFRGVSKMYSWELNGESGYKRKHFEGYSVTYKRELNGLPVTPGDQINVVINENGIITLGFISFRNYTQVGIVTILSPEKAYEKLKNREDVLDASMKPYSYIVKEISLCFWYINDEDMLIPAWHFKGDNRGYTVKGVSSYEFYSDID